MSTKIVRLVFRNIRDAFLNVIKTRYSKDITISNVLWGMHETEYFSAV